MTHPNQRAGSGGSEILDFQAGREARIAKKPRDGRRNADWLRGWDQVDDDLDRFTREHATPTLTENSEPQEGNDDGRRN